MNLLTTRRGFIAGAAALGVAGKATAQGLREIVIGQSSKSLNASCPRIAEEMGLFAKHGLKPRFILVDSANGTLSALIAKSVDFAIAGTADAIAANSRGQKVVIVANIFSGLLGSLVLSKKTIDRLGVSPTAPIDERLKALDGLAIASTSATSSFTVAYGQAAKSRGATIRFAYMALSAMVPALQTGAIDGFTGTAPFWWPPIENGTGVLWINGPKRGEMPAEFVPATSGTLQTTRDYAEAHPDIVKSLNAAILEFADAVDQRPGDVRAAIMRLYPELNDKMLDVFFAVEAEGYKAKQLSVADMAHDIAFVKSAGAVSSQIDELKPADLLYP